ncbi:zinc-ribbon domain containing protein [Hymenobacter glaciei]|uniref:zinc-ribbon domain containing protein n=1 Tax=Hymenobacter glaciei TaxID=877209 RepID=UPI0031EE35BE
MNYAKPHNSLRCPCCGEVRGPAEHQAFLKQVAKEVPEKTYITRRGILLGNVYWCDARKGLVDWACDECLQNGRALSAQPVKQLFCDIAPHFAYFDKAGVCRECGVAFTFSKGEQQHWYEHLRFWVQAEKVRCEACQQHKKRRDHFSQLMAANDYSNQEAVQEIIAYYLEEKEFNKAKQFLAAGKRNCGEGSSNFAVLDGLLTTVRQLQDSAQE